MYCPTCCDSPPSVEPRAELRVHCACHTLVRVLTFSALVNSQHSLLQFAQMGVHELLRLHMSGRQRSFEIILKFIIHKSHHQKAHGVLRIRPSISFISREKSRKQHWENIQIPPAGSDSMCRSSMVNNFGKLRESEWLISQNWQRRALQFWEIPWCLVIVTCD